MPSKTTKSALPYRYRESWYSVTDGVYWKPEVAFSPVYTNVVTYGANYPDWKQRIAQGIDATTYLNGQRYTRVKRKEGLMYAHPENIINGRVGRVGDLAIPPVINTSSYMGSLEVAAENKAKEKFVKQVNQIVNHFQGGVFLGELLETLRMIRNPAKGLREGLDKYHNYVKVKVKTASKISQKSLSEMWLEHVFGWAPLLNDVKDGAEALARLVNSDHDNVTRVTASATETRQVVPTQIFSSGGYAISAMYKYRMAQEHTCTVIYRAGVGSSSHSTLGMAQELFGFRWEDFVPTVWELIPYSFLVDYFVNIGDVLSAWAHQDFRKRWANRTIVKTIDSFPIMWLDQASVNDAVSRGFASYVQFAPSTHVRRYRTVMRDKYNGDYIPSLSFSIPGLGSQKWLNIGALLRLKTL